LDGWRQGGLNFMSRNSSYHSIDERISTGGGGRGPQPPEPFGGGGGGGRGDGDDTPSHGERLRRYRMGLYFMIGSIMMLFTAFTVLFVALRQSGRFDPFTGHFTSTWVSTPLPLVMLAVNTLVLLASSVTAEKARRAAALETVLMPVSNIPGVAPIAQTSVAWVKVTAALGVAFLLGQAYVWQRLHTIAVRMDNPISASFIMMLTGGHALHLFGGLSVLLYVAFSRNLIKKYESRRIAVDVTAWYWHFMGAMWVYVLVVLAFVH
jgi:cytochrome c oxidase subunit III